jgi:hypothetical protein
LRYRADAAASHCVWYALLSSNKNFVRHAPCEIADKHVIYSTLPLKSAV